MFHVEQFIVDNGARALGVGANHGHQFLHAGGRDQFLASVALAGSLR